MFDWLRKITLTVAATLIGGGNAACACAAEAMAPAGIKKAECHSTQPAAAIAHQTAHSGDHPEGARATTAHDHRQGAPAHDAQCGHCAQAAIGQSASLDDGVVAWAPKVFKTAATTAVFVMSQVAPPVIARFDKDRWRTPSTATPVTLKIRLQN